MKFKVCKLWILTGLIILLGACSKPEIESLTRPENAVSGRQTWSQLVNIKTLQADAILAWQATNGEHGKYKVRLFVALPDRLKIQWLSPWGSVVGQVLIAGKQFWLTDTRHKQTWHGMTADFEKILQERGEPFTVVATQFFKFWPLLFGTPEADDRYSSPVVFIEYLAVGSGENLSLAKTVVARTGEELHFRLFELKKLSTEQLMPLAVKIFSQSGQISINLRKYKLNSDISADTFIYKLKNFTIREAM